ncbi:ATP-binding protein [Nocardia brasiliensis]|uniref:ATP-binding protein n=1 Tax=Nocardia brasiliensis TaxID=37326 RepID=UPI00340B4156
MWYRSAQHADQLSGRPAPGLPGGAAGAETHPSIGPSIRACRAGHRAALTTAAERVARLAQAHSAGKRQAELIMLGRIPLLVVDEFRWTAQGFASHVGPCRS